MSNASGLSLVRRRKVSLAEWIRGVLTDDQKEGSCTAITLAHMNGTIEREIDAVKFGGRTWKEDDLAGRFQGKAEAYAQDLPGEQNFCLFAFYAGRAHPEAAQPFKIQGDSGIVEGLGSYPPDAKGEKQLNLASAQAALGIAFRQSLALFEASNRLIETMSRREEKLLADNTELFDVAKDMILKAADKEHEHRMAELKFSHDAEMKRKLIAMAPALANQFTGHEIFPQATADTSIVEALLERLTQAPEGTLPLLLSQLGVNPQDAAAITMRAKQYAEKKIREAEEAKLMVARKPEADEPTEGTPE